MQFGSTNMRKPSFVYLLLIASASVSSSALAGVGQTSSGVTTTVGTDPTAASAGVQSQSSNFVQENAASQSGTPVVSSTASTLAIGANGKPISADAANGTAKPGDPNSPAIDPKTGQPVVAVAVPVAPPEPPPDYVSNIKKVDRSGSTGPALAVVEPAAPAAPVVKTATTPTSDPPAMSAPGAQRQAAAATPRATRPVADADKRAAADHPANAATGGSGSTPDSFAFYVGLIIAGALLAFAAATFMRSEKGGK